MKIDDQMRWLLEGILAVLVAASVVGYGFSRRTLGEASRQVTANMNARIRAWWVICGVFVLALLVGRFGSVILFGLVSFLALREFITLTPTHRGDHRTLFWIFFIFTPIQYLLVAMKWYGLFTIFIPVYAFLFIPLRSAIVGDTERFLERMAKIQFGLMICVYCLSYAPALMMLEIDGHAAQSSKLLLFLVLIVELSDVLQYVFGKTLGRHPIAPRVSPNKTLEGFIGGVLAATLIGTLLWRVTPFRPWQAGLLSLAITLAGFAGGLCMSAIKRDRGVKDFGTMIPGHGGIMDRLDSLCYAAPVFFHLIRYFFAD